LRIPVWIRSIKGGLAAHREQDVVEEDGQVDGDHQALFLLSGYGSKLEADGAVWGKTFDGLVGVHWQQANAILLNKVCFVGTLFRASQFLSEELPIRLAHRVEELGNLPDQLSEMPSIKRVQDWYAQSFEVCRRQNFTPLDSALLTLATGHHKPPAAEPAFRCPATASETFETEWYSVKDPQSRHPEP